MRKRKTALSDMSIQGRKNVSVIEAHAKRKRPARLASED
ncbi:hypothetical protein FB99_27590 [Pantoea agglomerans]|nr:hypothetical protein FB99_27590 [Pantoea agglomerans]